MQGHEAATTDTEGGVKLWELRTGNARLSIAAGPGAANRAAFDASGQARDCPPRWCLTHIT